MPAKFIYAITKMSRWKNYNGLSRDVILLLTGDKTLGSKIVKN